MQGKARYAAITNRPVLTGLIFFLLMIISIASIFIFIPAIPQWDSYHQFADRREIWGIPNFWNVISNIPFFVISILGFTALSRQWHCNRITRKEGLLFLILFLGILLISVGSSYYHWAPDSNRLVWDRLPITIVFMALLSLTIMERISMKWGFALLFPLLASGICSVLYWHWSELAHHGDLRLYGLVQFYSMLLIGLILFLFPGSYPALKIYAWLFIFYLLAKICEYSDVMIYSLTNDVISGHTLKHLCAAMSAYCMVVILTSEKNDSAKGFNQLER